MPAKFLRNLLFLHDFITFDFSIAALYYMWEE